MLADAGGGGGAAHQCKKFTHTTNAQSIDLIDGSGYPCSRLNPTQQMYRQLTVLSGKRLLL